MSQSEVIIQSESEMIQSETEIIQSDSEVIQSDSDVIQSDSDIIQSDSEVIQSDSEIIQNLNIQTESEVIQSNSEIIQSESEVIQTETEVIQTEPEVIQSKPEPVPANIPEMKHVPSAKKAANLRAKFEKWEAEENRQNQENKDGDEVMPSLDSTRNLRSMFENKAQEASKVQVRDRPKVNRFVGGGGDKCEACGKTVYAMEKFEVQSKIIHKTCFKCCKCNSPLSMVTFTMGGGKLFCNSHYKQLFTEKGNYDAILSSAPPPQPTAN